MLTFRHRDDQTLYKGHEGQETIANFLKSARGNANIST